MKKGHILPILIVLTVFIALFLVISNNNGFKTYSNQYMSFQYPAGWETEDNVVGGVNIYNGSVNSTVNGWFYVVPYGDNLGKNTSNMDDFKSNITSIISNSNSPTIQNKTINGTLCTIINTNNFCGCNTEFSWKYCFFMKNGKGVKVAGYVKDISVLEHVVATFN